MCLMNVPHQFRVLSAALIASTLAAGSAHAQPAAERVGDFTVEVRTDPATGRDSSFATLWPEGGVFSSPIEVGPLFLACGGDSAALAGAVMLPAWAGSGDTLLVAWRLGHDEPDTLVMEGEEEEGIVWYLRAPDVAPVLQRALEVDSLVIETLGSPAGERGRFAYALAGLETVLGRLRCPVAPPAAGRRAGREIVQRLMPGAVPVSALSFPQLANRSEFARALTRNYPQHLRDEGVEGEVAVRFRVLESGAVDSASMQVTRSANEELSTAALASVRLLRFRPGRAYGRPVKVWIELPIAFTTSSGAQYSSEMAMMRYVESNYPRALRDAGVGGTVALRYQVSRNGRVDRNTIRILRSTHEGFNDVAIRAVQRLRYDASDDDPPDGRWVTEIVRFSPPGARSTPRD